MGGREGVKNYVTFADVLNGWSLASMDWRFIPERKLVTYLKRNWVRHGGEHITDTYITETDTTEPDNLSHNIIDIFIIET